MSGIHFSRTGMSNMLLFFRIGWFNIEGKMSNFFVKRSIEDQVRPISRVKRSTFISAFRTDGPTFRPDRSTT